MFSACSGIIEISETFNQFIVLAPACYKNMFANCINLKSVDILPVTTLTKSCYEGMFSGCTRLIDAPELPATIANERCYYSMFESCTSLVNAPNLPMKEIKTDSYDRMFAGCSNLQFVSTKLMSFDIPAADGGASTDWLSGVNFEGIFIGSRALKDTAVASVNTYPATWTYLDTSVFYIKNTRRV
jgi:hypothetical protein